MNSNQPKEYLVTLRDHDRVAVRVCEGLLGLVSVAREIRVRV